MKLRPAPTLSQVILFLFITLLATIIVEIPIIDHGSRDLLTAALVMVAVVLFLWAQHLLSAVGERSRELDQSRQLMSALLDNPRTCRGVLTPDGRILEMNRTILDLLGVDKEEVVGEYFWTTPWRAFAPDVRERLAAAVPRAAAGEPVRFEVPLMSGTGAVRDMVFSLKPMSDAGLVRFLIAEGEDITEKKRVEESLRKLFRAVEQAPVAVVITDLTGKIEFVNPAFTDLTGHTPEEVIGRMPDLFRSGITATEPYRELWDTISSGETWHGEFCTRKKSGEFYWEAASISPITDAQGTTTNFVAIKKNISHRKKVEEELYLTSLRLQKFHELSLLSNQPEEVLLEFALDAVVATTRSAFGSVSLISEDESSIIPHAWSGHVMAQCTVSPQPAAHSVSKSGLCSEAIRRRQPVITNDYVEQNPLKKGYPQGHLAITRHMSVPLIVDGRVVLLAMVANKELSYDDADVHHVTLIMTEVWRIILHKRADIALVESNRRFAAIFFQNRDALVLLHQESLKIMEANDPFLELYRLDRTDLPSIDPRGFVRRRDLLALIACLRHDSPAEGFLLERSAHFRKDGSRVHVTVSGKTIYLDDKRMILCTIRDISEQVRLENEVKATQAKLIQANKMSSLGMLVSGVAHEINNPNHCIGINASVLTATWNDVLPILRDFRERTGQVLLGGIPFEEMELLTPQLFQGITESSRRISGIVENMRNFTKGTQHSSLKELVDLNRTINNATSLLWHHIHKHSENFKLELDKTVPAATGDPQQIEQVIINLIMNGLQALPDRKAGVAVMSTFDADKNEVVIRVTDEGRGMGKRVLERLTEPFFTTREGDGGTGLGIYISATIIKDHGGELLFQSEHGRGTVATIRLPAAPDTVTASA